MPATMRGKVAKFPHPTTSSLRDRGCHWIKSRKCHRFSCAGIKSPCPKLQITRRQKIAGKNEFPPGITHRRVLCFARPFHSHLREGEWRRVPARFLPTHQDGIDRRS